MTRVCAECGGPTRFNRVIAARRSGSRQRRFKSDDQHDLCARCWRRADPHKTYEQKRLAAS